MFLVGCSGQKTAKVGSAKRSSAWERVETALEIIKICRSTNGQWTPLPVFYSYTAAPRPTVKHVMDAMAKKGILINRPRRKGFCAAKRMRPHKIVTLWELFAILAPELLPPGELSCNLSMQRLIDDMRGWLKDKVQDRN